MFEFFRRYNKIVMGFLFLLIIPSFVLFGVDRYQGDQKGEKVARVDGHDITRPEWDQQHRNEVDRIRRQMPNVEAAMLDSDAARYATLERMVRDRVLAAAAAKSNMTVSEERLARLFAEDTSLASFRTAEGKFDRERFMMATGQTPEQYEAAVRSDLATQQVLLGVSGTAFATPAQAQATFNAFYDRREVQLARFNPVDFKAKVTVSDADIETFYKDHAAQFQAPEQASVEYLVLDLDAAKKNIAVTEADLKSYYEQNSARFGTPEERRASHILITAPTSASKSEREAARAKAEQLLAQVKKAPETFADVARKNSQDPGSAEKGGDLDFVTRGAMVKPFEDAMFALKKGEISNVVESEFGYHIIQLKDIKPGVLQPFEQARATIENEVRGQQATQEFAKAAETFTDLVYQQPDSLQPAADKLKLAIRTANQRRAYAAARRDRPAGQHQLPVGAVRGRLAGPQAQHRGHRDRPEPARIGPRRKYERPPTDAAGRGEGQGAHAAGDRACRRARQGRRRSQARRLDHQGRRRNLRRADDGVAPRSAIATAAGHRRRIACRRRQAARAGGR
jgi:peptidyl-prolyl cis-trans isomerase D